VQKVCSWHDGYLTAVTETIISIITIIDTVFFFFFFACSSSTYRRASSYTAPPEAVVEFTSLSDFKNLILSLL
jgi:hypothetical protein